jgi:hypothetical protein
MLTPGISDGAPFGGSTTNKFTKLVKIADPP